MPVQAARSCERQAGPSPEAPEGAQPSQHLDPGAWPPAEGGSCCKPPCAARGPVRVALASVRSGGPAASAERQGGLRVTHNVPVHQLKGVNEQLRPVLPLASRGELGPLGGVDQHGHQPGVGGRVLRELRGV